LVAGRLVAGPLAARRLVLAGPFAALEPSNGTRDMPADIRQDHLDQAQAWFRERA
jgi:hypothetical protein